MSGLLRVLLLALALVSTSGLRVVVGSRRGAAARSTVRMALPKIEDARSLSTEEIEAEIATAKKVRARARASAMLRDNMQSISRYARHHLGRSTQH